MSATDRHGAKGARPTPSPTDPPKDDIAMAQRIDVKDLNIYYADFLAVEGVTMTIEPRSVTAFIGPSGCGKSTFLRTLNRMHEVIPGASVHGSVEMEGVDLYGADIDPVAVRRQIGMVFQRPNPFPTMSIAENVLAGVRLVNKKISKSDAAALVETSLTSANLWNEVKDRLDKPGASASPGPSRSSRRCCSWTSRARRSTRSPRSRSRT